MLGDLESVYIEIGDGLVQRDLGGRRPSEHEKKERGRRWLDENRQRICSLLQSPAAQRVLKGNGGVVEEQVRLLVDVVAAAAFNVPPVAVAKAVLILGESWFCE